MSVKLTISAHDKTILENLSLSPMHAAELLGRPDAKGAQYVSNYRSRDKKHKSKKPDVKADIKPTKADIKEISPIIGYINEIPVKISLNLFDKSVKEIIILTKDSFSIDFKDGEKRIYGI